MAFGHFKDCRKETGGKKVQCELLWRGEGGKRLEVLQRGSGVATWKGEFFFSSGGVLLGSEGVEREEGLGEEEGTRADSTRFLFMCSGYGWNAAMRELMGVDIWNSW